MKRNKPNLHKYDFISNYIEKKMKGHGLDYGIEYLSMLADVEQEAELVWQDQYGCNCSDPGCPCNGFKTGTL